MKHVLLYFFAPMLAISRTVFATVAAFALLAFPAMAVEPSPPDTISEIMQREQVLPALVSENAMQTETAAARGLDSVPERG